MTGDSVNLMPKRQQFNFAHLAIVGVCSFVLLGISVMKNGLPFSFGKGQVAGVQSPMTYEQIKLQIEEEAARSLSESGDGNVGDLSAILDPGEIEGEVAGLMTDIPSFDELVRAEELSEIPLTIVEGNSRQAHQSYANEMIKADSNGNLLGIMSALSSGNEQTLKTSSMRAQQMTAYLSTVEVPEEFAEYHRLRMIFYSLLSQISEAYVNQNFTDSFVQNVQAIMSLSEKMDSIRVDLSERYGVVL